jgi:hypothetical protein
VRTVIKLHAKNVVRALFLLVAAVMASGCSSFASPTTPASADTVDVLDFVIGAADKWPRRGDQAQHQVVDWNARQVCWVKYVNPSRFECWGWDEQWVYHLVDHALDGNTAESYRFTDGRWLPRTMPRSGEWTLPLPANRIRWFTESCVEVRGIQGIRVDDGPNLYPMSQRAWIENRDAGGDLGVRDVLILATASNAPGAAPNPPEKFYFARGAGWYRWESVRGSRSFNRMGGPAVGLGPGCGR